MGASSRRGRGPEAAVALAICLLAFLVRLPGLEAPLYEGAAGKQTHTAMVARNLYRGRSTWLRPIVDDVGQPGYFVKELPLVPGIAALLYRLRGGPDDALGRAIGIVSWLAAIPILALLVRRDENRRVALLAAAWFAFAPAAIAYSRAFMTDPTMVAVSLAALLAALAWRDRPTNARAASTGALVGMALLLKPHAAFWLAPAIAIAVLQSRRPDAGAGTAATGAPPTASQFARLCLAIATGVAIAGAWYVHAAAVHRLYPAPGATVASGWVEPGLWASPQLHRRIAAQFATIVFSPLGVVLAVIALWPGREPFGTTGLALLAWGAGVVVQSEVFGTRMFDDAARGTEYYQLPAVATAALLVARGIDRLGRAAGQRWPGSADAACIALGVLAALAAVPITRSLTRAPALYEALPAQCARVRELTAPEDLLLVVADRGGTVLYTCDRRGTTFTVATAMGEAARSTRTAAGPEALSRAMSEAGAVFLPFPDLVPAALRDYLDREWSRASDETVVLYRRRTSGAR